MAGQTSRKNGKKGGRPKGKKSAATLEREAVLAAFRQRVMGVADLLLDSQLALARGTTYLYKIEKQWVPTGKGKDKGYYRKLRPKLVESQWEIEQYLEGVVENGDVDDDRDPAAAYYFLTTKAPDNDAIDSMMDRTFGKATQVIDLKHDVTETLADLMREPHDKGATSRTNSQ